MITLTIKPIAFSTGHFPVHWYGIFITLGVIAIPVPLAAWLSQRTTPLRAYGQA